MNRDTNKTFRHVKLNFFILACAKKTNMEKNTKKKNLIMGILIVRQMTTNAPQLYNR